MNEELPAQRYKVEKEGFTEKFDGHSDEVPCAYLTTTPTGTVVNVNHTFRNWTGFACNEIVGQRTMQSLLVNGGNIFYETHCMPQLLIHDRLDQIAIDMICRDGRIMHGYLNAILVRDSLNDPAILRFAFFDASERRRQEHFLQQREANLSQKEMVLEIAVRMTQVGAWSLTLDQDRVIWSDEVALIHGEQPGFSPTPQQAVQYYAPEFRSLILNAVQSLIEHGVPFDEELEINSRQGKRIWVRAIGEAVYDEDGKVVGIHGAFCDVSHYKSAQQEITRLADRLSTTLESITEAFYTLDRQWQFTFLNQEAERILRRQRCEIIGTVIWTSFPQTIGTQFETEYRSAMRSGQKGTFEEYFAPLAAWFEVNVYPSDEGLAIYFRDVTERKKVEEQIQQLAFYDSLTGLPNRHLFHKQVEAAIEKSRQTESVNALLLIDLDNFKLLNDSLGHAAGDVLLQMVGQRISKCIRSVDTVCRLGGDEFVVLVEQLSNKNYEAADCAEKIADKIRESLIYPFSFGDRIHHISASIGVSFFDGDLVNASEGLKRADIAMYQAKAAGRNFVCMFDDKMQNSVNERADFVVDLRTGLENDQFALYYQPLFNNEEKIIGVEALLRWHHPERGMVSPAEFIPLAEETGLIIPLSDWAMHQACRQLAIWQKNIATSHIPISVNVSATQLQQADFVDKVINAIQAADVDPYLLKLELTESLLVNNVDTSIQKMNALAKLGICFALDDFGTGYSSLSYLKRLPLESLKIDQSFVRDLTNDPDSAAIASAIISMAKSLGLTVIAEGVETMAQKKALTDLGCHNFQGYVFCRPLPVDKITEFIILRS